jgi:uncharacterized membrane protein
MTIQNCSSLLGKLAFGCNWRFLTAVLGIGFLLLAHTPSSHVIAMEPAHVADETGADFANNVVPILAQKCLRCHQESRSEGDFRIDDPAALGGFVKAGNLEESGLWTEHLAADASNPMPPEDENDPLNETELATIKSWILSGGAITDQVNWRQAKASENKLKDVNDVASLLWIILGRMHPAVLHFPVALLSVAALFAVFAFGSQHMDKAAMYCLFLGSVGACVAAVSGWGFAEHEGWGAWSDEKFGEPKYMHRWGGISVAALSILVFGLAFFTRMSPTRSQLWWKLGVVLVAALVGFVGHLGGKLTHDDLYTEPLLRLQELLSKPDPTDPSDQTDQTDPSDQTDPTDPSDQTDPTDPSDQTDPTDS